MRPEPRLRSGGRPLDGDRRGRSSSASCSSWRSSQRHGLLLLSLLPWRGGSRPGRPRTPRGDRRRRRQQGRWTGSGWKPLAPATRRSRCRHRSLRPPRCRRGSNPVRAGLPDVHVLQQGLVHLHHGHARFGAGTQRRPPPRTRGQGSSPASRSPRMRRHGHRNVDLQPAELRGDGSGVAWPSWRRRSPRADYKSSRASRTSRPGEDLRGDGTDPRPRRQGVQAPRHGPMRVEAGAEGFWEMRLAPDPDVTLDGWSDFTS